MANELIKSDAGGLVSTIQEQGLGEMICSP